MLTLSTHAEKLARALRDPTISNIFVERSIISNEIFAVLQEEDGFMEGAALGVYKNALSAAQEMMALLIPRDHVEAMHIYLRASPDVCDSRIRNRDGIAAEDNAVDKAYQRRLLRAHERAFPEGGATVLGKVVRMEAADCDVQSLTTRVLATARKPATGFKKRVFFIEGLVGTGKSSVLDEIDARCA